MLFFRRGRSAAIFVPTLVNPAAPKVTEITAGVDLSAAVTAITGWETTLTRISQPVMKYPEELQTDGPQTFADSSLTFLEDDGTGTDADSVARQGAYVAMAAGSSGYMLLHPTRITFTAADKIEVWPAKVGSRNRSWSLEGESARYTAAFVITGQPIKDAAVTT